MSRPTNTFEEVKSILLTKSIPELEEYITLKGKKTLNKGKNDEAEIGRN